MIPKKLQTKLIQYAELLAAVSGLWFGLIQPTFRHLVKNEIAFQNYLLMEIATDKQIENATRKWKAGKE